MTARALAVSAMRGVSRVWVSPENSAPSMRAAPAPMVGATATKRTTIPSPPSQWVMLRQKRIEGVSASTTASSVAPVVVKPLIDSKVESRRFLNVPSSMYGIPPSNATSTQAKVTERYTSRSRTYPTLCRRDARRPATPIGIITAAGIRKLFQEPSRYSNERTRGTKSARPKARITPALTPTTTLALTRGRPSHHTWPERPERRAQEDRGAGHERTSFFSAYEVSCRVRAERVKPYASSH